MLKKDRRKLQHPQKRLVKTKPFIAGLWKFKSSIPLKKLINIAKKWVGRNEGYYQLYIRQVGPDENAIAFIFQSHDILLEDYLRNTSQELKKQFGEDLTGWDIATSMWLAK